MPVEDRGALAERAARAGAAVAEAAFRRGLAAEAKTGPMDLVTEADRDAQVATRQVLEEADPGAVIVAEEDDTAATVPESGPAWVVDPIDGTRNFVAGSRLWATSVAATNDGAPVAGATVLPACGDAYVTRGAETTRNGDPVTPTGHDALSQFAVVPLGWWPAGERDELASLMQVLASEFGDLRRLGCAQAALAMVASGELDAVVSTRRPPPWDTIAGVALVERAGGDVTGLDGRPWRHDTAGLVASNGRCHGSVLAALESLPEASPGSES